MTKNLLYTVLKNNNYEVKQWQTILRLLDYYVTGVVMVEQTQQEQHVCNTHQT